MIECKDLTVKIRNKTILENVNFTAETGKITVLLGKNGSGKSTLLRCITGSIRSHTGTVTLDGHEIKTFSSNERARKIAVMPQVIPLPRVTVRELVSFGRYPYSGYGGRLSDSDKKIIEKAMEITSVSSRACELVCNLSGGERQLVFFTMLIAQDSPLVMLDEPASSLDTVYTSKVSDLILSMRDAGKTVISVMHDIPEAIKLADCIYVLDGGKNIFSGTSDKFLESDVPDRIFGLSPIPVTTDSGERFTILRR